MKQLMKPIRRKISPIKLYLNDIETIKDILYKYTKNIAIYTDDYKVEDIKQLKNLEEKRGHHLFIQCHEPDIDIDFRPNQASIYFSKDTITNRGILSKIEDILQSREIPFGRFLTSSWASILYIVIILSIFIVPYTLGYNVSNNFAWLYLVLFGLLILTIGLSIYWFLLQSYSTIMFIEKKEESSFWKRNKEKILVAVISGILSAIIGGIIGSIITYLLTK